MDQLKGNVEFYKTIKRHLKPEYRNTISSMLSKQYFELAQEYENQNSLKKAKLFLKKSLSECPLNNFIASDDLIHLSKRLLHKSNEASNSDVG